MRVVNGSEEKERKSMCKYILLMGKLDGFNARGPASMLLASYLVGRQQFAAISGQRSCRRLLKVVVPEGSVLGSLLFLVYINDITKHGKFGALSLS